MLSSPLGSHRQRAEPRWIRSVRGEQERTSRLAQSMIQSDAEDVNRGAAFSVAASLPLLLMEEWCWLIHFLSDCTRNCPFLFFLTPPLPFVCNRYGSGLHIRATMPWLHYCLKAGGEVKEPCITFSCSRWYILFNTVKAGTKRRCPTKEFGGMALWSCA